MPIKKIERSIIRYKKKFRNLDKYSNTKLEI